MKNGIISNEDEGERCGRFLAQEGGGERCDGEDPVMVLRAFNGPDMEVEGKKEEKCKGKIRHRTHLRHRLRVDGVGREEQCGEKRWGG